MLYHFPNMTIPSYIFYACAWCCHIVYQVSTRCTYGANVKEYILCPICTSLTYYAPNIQYYYRASLRFMENITWHYDIRTMIWHVKYINACLRPWITFTRWSALSHMYILGSSLTGEPPTTYSSSPLKQDV